MPRTVSRTLKPSRSARPEPAAARRSTSVTSGKKAAARTRKPGPASQPAAGINSDAVERATGKGWDAWFDILDRSGALTLDHKEIATRLHTEHGLSGWWSQMVTVGYEQARLGRQKHERPDGFQVSASRTIQAPLPALYVAWSDPRQRSKWLAKAETKFHIRTATEDKSMRITWIDGRTHVDAHFYAKNPGKSRITVQHRKLPTAEQAVQAKAAWADRLDRLKAVLER
ncbi:MAG: DUF4287 domain-containing protein [Phycisphaerales bacterium]|nr:MAG: DUF4287 domain-containing protein [Phycisphaerales bacterium]